MFLLLNKINHAIYAISGHDVRRLLRGILLEGILSYSVTIHIISFIITQYMEMLKMNNHMHDDIIIDHLQLF